jgi:hypothetical protein
MEVRQVFYKSYNRAVAGEAGNACCYRVALAAKLCGFVIGLLRF